MAEDKFWEPTIKLFSGLIQKPKMSDKLLQKPPFKYLFDIVSATIEATGFGEGIYNEQEKDANYYENRDLKIMYLRKVIDLTQYAIGKGLAAKPNKIVAGLEPENTNQFLQEFHRAATTPELSKKGPKIIKKLLEKYGNEAENGGAAEGNDAAEKPSQPAKQEKPAPPQAKEKEAPKKEAKQDVPPPQPKVERSNSKNAGGQVDEPVAVVKQNMRPSSAVKAPPKIANNVVKVTDNSSKGRGTTGVIVDRGNNDDDDDQDKDAQQGDRGNQGDAVAGSVKGISKFTSQALNDGLGTVPQAQKDQGGDEENKGGIQLKRKVGGKLGTKTGTGGAGGAGGNASSASGNNASLQGGSSANDIQALTAMVQEIAKNANPLGKSLEFITDDIESMNHELDIWTKQYKQHKEKMQTELKITEEMLQPIQDQIAEIEEKISDKRNNISNVKAQLIKNQSQIQTLLYSVVSSK